MTKQIFTMGYSGRTVTDLIQIAQALDAIIFDIRLSPRSRRTEFSRKRLTEALGERYRHVPELGNINYKTSGPIQIANLDAGVAQIAASERPVVLLCVCSQAEKCHRTAVGNHFRKLGCVVEEITDGYGQALTG